MNNRVLTGPLGALELALAERYELIREIGRGGWGIVYLAHERANERPVAIKVLRVELGATQAEQRFAREIHIATQLSHPNIVPVIESGEVAGSRYLVMPFIDGETLKECLARERQLPVDVAVRISVQVADALAYAHSADVVHRDIKPGNILLAGGRVMIADFGIARAISKAAPVQWQSSNRTQVGTVEYMSPEQAAGDERVDGRSDIYSLGCVTYEMLAGSPPFTGATPGGVMARHALDSVPTLRTVRREVSASVEAVIERALAKTQADRYQTADEFASALTAAAKESNGPRSPIDAAVMRLRRATGRRRAIVAGVLALVAMAAAWTLRQRQLQTAHGADLDSHLIAVAPFAVLDTGFGLWREGFVDVLSRNLDGAGSIRSVSPTTAVREWRRSDKSAAELCRRTRARYSVQGALLRSGRDSVRVSTALYDAARGKVIGEAEFREPMDHVDRIADRATVEVLRQLGQSGEASVAETRLATAAAASSPLALKALLHAERFFRQTAWDSAIVYYRRAIDIDPRQPWALLRLSLVKRWQGLNSDSLAAAYALQADSMNHGLAPRESLMVRAGALFAKMTRGFADSEYWKHRSELFSTLDAAVQRYPNETELWYTIAEARYRGDASATRALDAYDRAIRIDSNFAPAYPNAIVTAMALRGAPAARRYLDAYLRTQPTDVHADGYRLAGRLMDLGVREPSLRPILDTASADVLENAREVMAYWPDSNESVVYLSRTFAAGRSAKAKALSDSTFRSFQLASDLAFRGHLREAVDVLGTAPSGQARMPGSQYLRRTIAASLMLFGARPDKDTRDFFAQLARGPVDQPTGLIMALPWWSERRDTMALLAVIERARSVIERGRNGVEWPYVQYFTGAARGYLQLARGDSTGASSLLAALPDSGCMYPYCPYERLVSARLYAGRGDLARASAILDEIPNFYGPFGIIWRYYRAQVAARRGQRDIALHEYQYVSDAWVHADSVLQPFVASSRSALQQLATTR